MTPVRLEATAPLSRVKHSTIEPLPCHVEYFYVIHFSLFFLILFSLPKHSKYMYKYVLMGHIATKPVFWVSDKASFKSVS